MSSAQSKPDPRLSSAITHSSVTEMFYVLIAFLYGLISYAVFFLTFIYAIGFVSDPLVPKTIDYGASSSTSAALVVNIGLMSLFAIQHSVMARSPFKDWYVPKPIERSTYVLFASLALILLFWQWRPLPNVVWHIENAQVAAGVTGISLIGCCSCSPAPS